MSISEQVRRNADPFFSAIRQHPFVQDIAHERLSRAAIIHYVQQDVQYLKTYAKVYGLAIAKSQTQEQMQLFHERIKVVLSGELIPHYNLCRVAGVNYETMKQPVSMAPTTHHYARHMLSAAYTGSLMEIIAAVLPCHWTYVDLARDIAKAITIGDHPNHLFYDWITFYASDSMLSSLHELTTLLDECAREASASDIENIQSIFNDGCLLEYRFFDMAYKQETWSPSELEVLNMGVHDGSYA